MYMQNYNYQQMPPAHYAPYQPYPPYSPYPPAPQFTPEQEVEKEDDNAEEEYFTETLARIYIKQGRYSKALEIIKRLSLAYPKKNAYFADQIRFLEKLIINSNNKNS